MSPDEVIERAGRHGEQVSRSTLHWYVRKRLMPQPTIRGLGRGRGVSSEFPPEAPAELVASKRLLRRNFMGKRVTAEELADIRRRAYQAETLEPTAQKSGHEAWRQEMLLQAWLEYRARVLLDLPPEEADPVPRTLIVKEDGTSSRPLVERVKLVRVDELMTSFE